MSKPNIIFIMTDQQRWDCLGGLNPNVKTPTLDMLAENGVVFDQAVCQCPMCVPSRNSMMFGMYPSQIGVRSNFGGINDESRLPSKPLPQLLHDEGYFCAGFGKTHWNHGFNNEHPSRRGFDIRVIGQPRDCMLYEEGAVMMDDEDSEGMKAYFDEVEPFGMGEENYKGYLGCTSDVAPEHHRDGFVYKKCMEFLDNPPEDKPLFLYLSFLKPHAGFNIPPEFEGMYNIKDIPEPYVPQPNEGPTGHIKALSQSSDILRRIHEERREGWESLSREERKLAQLRYWANCTFLDSFMGKVLKKAGDKGITDNAIIIFVSDHGDMMGERDYRFSKYCLYESSVRVPLIVSGSALDKGLRGKVDGRPAELVDIIPTICDVAGIKADPRMPGYSLLREPKRSGAFCEMHGGGPEGVQPAPAWMWRNNNYKLILYREGNVLGDGQLCGELYNLKNDPYEKNNIYCSGESTDVKLKMMEELISHKATVYAKGPAFWDMMGYKKLEG